MPFTRIALQRGKSNDYLHTLSDTLHQALVDAFDVPAADKFQAIDQYSPGELIYDRDYLGGPRSSEYTLFYITSGRPRSTATKQRFYQRLVALLAQNLQLRPEDVMVIIACTEADAGSFSAGRIAMLPGRP